MVNIIRLLTIRNALYLSVSALVMAGFQFLMTAIVATMDIPAAFEELIRNLPPFIQTMLSEQLFGGLTERGLLAFGWNHPITQALGTAAAIVIASRAVAGEIEHGSLELILAQPVSRTQYLGAQTLFAILSLVLLSIGGIFGTTLGQWAFRHDVLELSTLVRLGANYFLLQIAWLGLAMLFSVYGREGGRVAAGVFMLALVSYLVQVVGSLWTKAAFLLPYSLHHYYTPQAIVGSQGFSAQSVGVLLGVAAMTFVTAFWRFQRRDVP